MRHSAEAIEELRRKKAASIGADRAFILLCAQLNVAKIQTLRQGTSIVPLGAISLENQCMTLAFSYNHAALRT